MRFMCKTVHTSCVLHSHVTYCTDIALDESFGSSPVIGDYVVTGNFLFDQY